MGLNDQCECKNTNAVTLEKDRACFNVAIVHLEVT